MAKALQPGNDGVFVRRFQNGHEGTADDIEAATLEQTGENVELPCLRQRNTEFALLSQNSIAAASARIMSR